MARRRFARTRTRKRMARASTRTKGRAPGKTFRKGMSLAELVRKFPDDATAEAWFVNRRWPNDEVCCPYCGSLNVQVGTTHKTMPYRCREKDCTKWFSTKTGTVMEGSKLGFQIWIIAVYLLTTNIKSVSSMKLHHDLDINQRSAWFLAHRLRMALAKKGGTNFGGPVEVDETYVGGKRANMSRARRKKVGPGRGTVGKAVVAGAKDRKTKKVRAKMVRGTDKETLHRFVADSVAPGATIYSDEAAVYGLLPNPHAAVHHGAGEYVRGDVHINGIESFWSTLKRAHKGTFHKLSPKHLNRYVQEFVGRHNLREQDTLDIMAAIVDGMRGKRLKYKDLIADNGLDSFARPRS